MQNFAINMSFLQCIFTFPVGVFVCLFYFLILAYIIYWFDMFGFDALGSVQDKGERVIIYLWLFEERKKKRSRN